MKFEDFEHRIGPGGYREIKVKCFQCGNDHWMKWCEYGDIITDGKYCSRKCYYEGRKGHKNDSKEKATKFLDISTGAYHVTWFEGNKQRTSTYAKWWWETHNGPIPKGYWATYKDGNPSNTCDDNICIISPTEFGEKIRQTRMGKKLSEETRMKLSDGRRKGDKNPFWLGGRSTEVYPQEFSAILRDKIKDRDGNKCRICGKDTTKKTRCAIHHIDANKNNNSEDNLILLCHSCHCKVHMGKTSKDPVILAFHSKLYT